MQWKHPHLKSKWEKEIGDVTNHGTLMVPNAPYTWPKDKAPLEVLRDLRESGGGGGGGVAGLSGHGGNSRHGGFTSQLIML